MIEDTGSLVRPAPQDASRIAAMIAAAMNDYPLIGYFFPVAAERRLRLAQGLFGLLVDLGIRQGTLLSTSPRNEGIACWQPPEASIRIGNLRVLGGGLKLLAQAGPAAMRRMIGAYAFGLRARRRHAPGPHWYLIQIAVDPAHQGQGHAGALLRPVLAHLQRVGLPCYLETHQRRNVPLYEHFGFRVVEELLLPGSAVRQWCMLKA